MRFDRDIGVGVGIGAKGISVSYTNKSNLPNLVASVAPIAISGFESYARIKESGHNMEIALAEIEVQKTSISSGRRRQISRSATLKRIRCAEEVLS